MTDLLSEPESVAERRKELNDMIKVMRNAQKISRRDPDLMTVMQINISDNDIAPEVKKKEEKKPVEKKESKPIQEKEKEKEKEKPKPPQPALKPNEKDTKKKTYGNLFG